MQILNTPHTPNTPQKKSFLQKLGANKAIRTLALLSTLSGGAISISSCENKATNTEQIEIVLENGLKYRAPILRKFNNKELLKKPQNISYATRAKEKTLELIQFPKVSRTEMIQSKVWPTDKIIRCLRWKAITDIAEEKYGIPQGLLLAMMAQEGAGDPTLPNVYNRKTNPQTNRVEISLSDGGLGLIHIQGANAEDYGLKVMQVVEGKSNSRSMQDFELGKKLIDTYQQNLPLDSLCKLDERWNPVLAVDAAARFLRSKYNPKDGKDARILALGRYSGRKWTDYASKVINYWVIIDQHIQWPGYTAIPSFSAGVESVVEQAKIKQQNSIKNLNEIIKNIKIKIDHKEWNYEDYLNYNAEQSRNYGLDAYKQYHPQEIE